MRSNYPISSKELQDRFDLMYERLSYLLGTDVNISGLYHSLETDLINQFIGCDVKQMHESSGIYNLENADSPHIFLKDINAYNMNKVKIDTYYKIRVK